MTRKQKRLAVIGGLGIVVAIATALILTALRDQIVFFYSPTELAAKNIPAGQSVRLGGLVKEGSWSQEGDLNLFVVSDGQSDVSVEFTGIPPDLFREGQGVIAEGRLGEGQVFKADSILAKHDENYIPKEVVEALKASGEWRPDSPEAVEAE